MTAGVLYLQEPAQPDRRRRVVGDRAYYQGLGALRSRGVFDDTTQYVANVQALRGRFGG